MKTSISILFVLAAVVFSGCALASTPPPPTLTPSPIPPTSTSTPQPTATAPPTFTPTFTPTPVTVGWILYNENEWMTLSYPSNWKAAISPETSCSSSDSSNCILSFSHVLTDDVVISIYRLPKMIPSFNNANDADDYEWRGKEMEVQFAQVADALKLISRSEITVGGLPAIKRLYEYPYVDPLTNTIRVIQYEYQVISVKDGATYYIRMSTEDPDTFNKYLENMDELVKTIVFLK